MTIDTGPIRAWFDEHGWQLDTVELSSELRGRGVDDETRVDWIDEAAVRKEQQAARDTAFVEAGEYLLGALLLAGADGPDMAAAALDRARRTGVTAAMFERHHQRLIYAAIERVVDSGASCEFLAVEADLHAAGTLDAAGGPARVRTIARLVPAVANIDTYARGVVDQHRRTEQERLALELQRASQNGGVTSGLRDQLLQILEPVDQLADAPEAVGGGTFIFDEPVDDDAIRVWGDGSQIAWAAGEGLMLVGPDGVGKTTLGQQVAIARAGLRQHVLGMPVKCDGRRVLYIAADRPRQAARSLRRMVTETERDQLDQAVTVWRGPLPAVLNEERTMLSRLAKQFDAGTIIIDSLKDVAFDLATDEAAGRIATCFQHAIAAGIELLVLHHPRKPGVDSGRKPRELSDVYGNRLIFGVFGSVIMLWGDPGDAYIELDHAKQPIDPVGPWKLHHDHAHGHTEIEKGTDLVDLVLRTGTTGITAKAAAGLVYEKDDPTKNDIERIRQRLKTLTRSGRLVEMPSTRGDDGNRFFFNGPAEALQ